MRVNWAKGCGRMGGGGSSPEDLCIFIHKVSFLSGYPDILRFCGILVPQPGIEPMPLTV